MAGPRTTDRAALRTRERGPAPRREGGRKHGIRDCSEAEAPDRYPLPACVISIRTVSTAPAPQSRVVRQTLGLVEMGDNKSSVTPTDQNVNWR
jgi:hypothetical protein